MFRSSSLLSLLVAGFLCIAPPVRALTVEPPSFEKIVSDAPTIVRARVAGVVSRWVTNASGATVLKTFVTFDVTKVLKGEAKPKLVLSFLGGEVGDERWEVPGMPTFQVGDDQYLFVTKEGGICPLAGVMHGRYRVASSQALKRAYVARDNHVPLTNVAEVQLPMRALPPAVQAAAVPRALAPEAFEQAIAQELGRSTEESVK